MTVQGLDKLQRKLKRLPDVMLEEVRKALEANASEMVRMAKGLVPVDQGYLRDSIGWTFGDPPSGSIALAEARGSTGLRVTVFAGNDKAYYARWVEFGTVRTPAQPFFYPSYRSLKKRMQSKNRRAMRSAAKKVAGNGK